MIDIRKRLYPEHLAALSLYGALEVPERERFAQDMVLSVLEESVRQHHDGRPFPTSRVMHDVLLAAGYALIAVRAQEQAERILQEDRDMRAACPLEVDNVKVGDAVVWVDPDMAAPDSPRPSPTRGVVIRFLMHQDEWRALCTGGWWCQPRDLSVEMTAAQRRAFPDALATVDAPASEAKR